MNQVENATMKYTAFQNKALETKDLSELLLHSKTVESSEDKMFMLKHLLNYAVVLEFATIPIYLQAMWSIKDNKCEVAKSIRNIFQEEMLHMAMVCNMIVGIGGEPKIYDTDKRLQFPTGLPGGVHPDLFLHLEGLNDCSLRNFIEIELPDEIATIKDYETGKVVSIGNLCDNNGKVKTEKYELNLTHNKTIGDLYEEIRVLFIELQPTMNVERQLAGPLSWWVMSDVESVSKAIDMIKEQGEGAQISDKQDIGWGDELAHFYRFWEVYYEKKIVKEKGEYFFKDPMPRPETINIARIPEGGYQEADVTPEVWHLVSEFDKSYTELVKLLEEAWAINGRGQAALVNAIDVMFKLERYALPLMQIPIPNNKERASYGPCFRML